MDVSLLSEDVLGAVRQQLGCEDPDDESKDAEIAAMKPLELFDRYLAWEGVIGFGYDFWMAVDNIRAAAGLGPGEPPV